MSSSRTTANIAGTFCGLSSLVFLANSFNSSNLTIFRSYRMVSDNGDVSATPSTNDERGSLSAKSGFVVAETASH